MERFSRTEGLIGKQNIRLLSSKKVALFGVGGVGGFALEALVRSGIGNIDIFDNDVVSISNLNRQIIATADTIGKDKVEVAVSRAKSINPQVNINGYKIFYLPYSAEGIDLSRYDYIIDAIDTVTAKLELIKRAKACNVKIISCMGTGGKLNPGKLVITDIYKTNSCPLARVMRRELKKLGVDNLEVIYSTEEQITSAVMVAESGAGGKNPPASMIFVPAVAGIMLANKVVLDLIK